MRKITAYEIALSDEQQHDTEFLTRLYDANPHAFDRFPPSRLNPEFSQDIDFMINYFTNSEYISNLYYL